jgi:uncharacterized protein (TIGR04255 family)
MLFPESRRVIYGKNPLEEVICQLRFPPILRIDTEIPAAYQERIRHEYPLFLEPQEEENSLGIPPEIAKLVGGKMPFHVGRSFNFLSADEKWKVTLTRDFLALSTLKYERWEQFKERLKVPLDALVSHYQPVFFTRIGLRYRNVIRRSALALGNVEWSALLKQTILGELADPNLSGAIESATRDLVFKLDGHGKLRVKHGLAPSKATSEVCYLIDSDFFTEERTGTNNAIGILDTFNQQSGRLFRWCIQDRLHEAMGPRSIDS